MVRIIAGVNGHWNIDGKASPVARTNLVSETGSGVQARGILVEVQGMSHRQASAVLRCSENTVSWRMHRARLLLQARLRPYLEGGKP